MFGVNSNGLSLDELRGVHRRLAMLRALSRLPQYTGSLRLLKDYLDLLALSASSDVVRDDLRRLKEIGLVEINEGKAVWPVTITERGLEVAEGKVIVDIVRRPDLDEPY